MAVHQLVFCNDLQLVPYIGDFNCVAILPQVCLDGLLLPRGRLTLMAMCLQVSLNDLQVLSYVSLLLGLPEWR